MGRPLSFVKFEVPHRQQLASGTRRVFVEARRTQKGFGTRKGLLRYGIDIRCKKRLPGARDAFSKALGAKNRLLRYRMEIRCKKQASPVRDGHI